MIYVALALAAAVVLLTYAYSATIRSLTRQQARERDLLLNQLYNAVGRPWQPAPASEPIAEEPVQLYAVSPEQFPDDFDWEE